MREKIKVGAVSYLNTKPLTYGFEHGSMKDEIDLIMDYPANIASMLLNNEIDIGLVPVAIIPELKEQYIISDYCIGCDGEVASVCLFSEVPLDKIENILLDYQSRTSVQLLEILLKKFWKLDPNLIITSKDYRSEITGTTAGLIIGDRALAQRKISTYKYDLGIEWKKFSGLPFVFAAWVSNKKIDKLFIQSFNKANSIGLQKLDDVITENPCTDFDLTLYYTNYISYNLNENARKGLTSFLNYLGSNKA